MRLAVFTNQFPGRVSTFFARDMSALIRAHVEVDVFPIYPLDESLWQYVPPELDTKSLPSTRVRHLGFGEALQATRPWPWTKFSRPGFWVRW